MVYSRQENDEQYRLVNLKNWDRESRWQNFMPNERQVEVTDRYILLEIKHKDGTTELRESGRAKERVYWQIKTDGSVIITFQSEGALRNGPFLGHLFLTMPGKDGIRYSFPKTQRRVDGNMVVCNFCIGTGSSLSQLQLEGDKYFKQIFVLEKF